VLLYNKGKLRSEPREGFKQLNNLTMEFEFKLEKITESHHMEMWGNSQKYRWESGGAFGSSWSEKKWYEGILYIKNRFTKAKRYFYFNTRIVRDSDLYEFSLENIFDNQSLNENSVDEFCRQIWNIPCKENSPFPELMIDSFKLNNEMEVAE
jgi:hypothetical protein